MGWLRTLEKMATLYHNIISLQEVHVAMVVYIVQHYNKLGVMYLTMFCNIVIKFISAL